MADVMQFVKNYDDLSNKRGYQFEFKCDRCGIGFRTKFKASATGTMSEVLNTAGGFLGGILGNVADVGEKVRSAKYQRDWEKAYEEAVKEITPKFIQCPRCSKWVCKEHCWNETKGLCKECAPDIGVEASAAQASRTVGEVWAHAKVAEKDKPSNIKWDKQITATCPKCHAPLEQNAGFCSKCGQKIEMTIKCPGCNEEVDKNMKFCPKCGGKL